MNVKGQGRWWMLALLMLLGGSAWTADLPLQPTNLSPASADTQVELTAALQASDYACSDSLATQLGAQWRVWELNPVLGTSQIVYDQLVSASPYTTVTLPSGALHAKGEYLWSVRYLNENGWGPWSAQTGFSTIDGIQAGINWLLETQTSAGGWTPCDSNIPATIEILALTGHTDWEVFEPLLQNLLDLQLPQGSWSESHYYTYTSVRALRAAGFNPTHPSIAQAASWIKSVQLEDGSWSHLCTSTGSALSILHLAGEGDSPQALKGIQWLVAQQNDDGGWHTYPGDPSSIGYMTAQAWALVHLLEPDDPAVQAMLSYYKSCGDWVGNGQTGDECGIFSEAGDLVEATNLVNLLKSKQHADGGFSASGESTSQTLSTAAIILGLARYRAAGGTGVDTAIDRAVAFIKNYFNTERGFSQNYETIGDSAFSGAVLSMAGLRTSTAVQKCLTRFLNHGPSWYGHFYEPTTNYGTIQSGMAIQGLVEMTANPSHYMAEDTLDQMLLRQYEAGGFIQRKAGDYTGTLRASFYALFSMHLMHKENTQAFADAYAWLVAYYDDYPAMFYPYEKGFALICLADYEPAADFITQLIQELKEVQQLDGGWSSGPEYVSSMSQTTMPVIGLCAVGHQSEMLTKAVAWIRDQQNDDGGWYLAKNFDSSNCNYTATALWALLEAKDVEMIQVGTATDREAYLGGETVNITVTTSEENVDSLTGTITSPDNQSVVLSFVQIDANTWAGSYVLDVDQPLGTYTIAANAIKGELFGSAVQMFDVCLNRPINISPFDGQTGISISPTLVASDFDDSQTTATHVASQWQVYEINAAGGTQELVYDSGQDNVSLTSIAMPSGTLAVNRTYAWSVRYLDSTGRWTAWSNQTQFTTFGGQTAGANWLVEHQHTNGGWAAYTDFRPYAYRALYLAGASQRSEFKLLKQAMPEEQLPNGSWNHSLLETVMCISNLVESGESISSQCICEAVNWLLDEQETAGNWGQTRVTAEAVLALNAVGLGQHPKVLKAVEWIVSTQNADGGWGLYAGDASNTMFPHVIKALLPYYNVDDPVIQKALQFTDAKVASNYWATFNADSVKFYISLYGALNQTTVVEKLYQNLLVNQMPGGEWNMTGSDVSVSSYAACCAIAAMCDARSAGVNISESLLTASVDRLVQDIDENGFLSGHYEEVASTCWAITALVEAECDRQDVLTLASQRMLGHVSPLWHPAFYSTGYYSEMSSYACVALKHLGGDDCLALAQDTIDEIYAHQGNDGGWGAGDPATSVSNMNHTSMILCGLAQCGEASDSRFNDGVQWVVDAVAAGETFGTQAKARMVIALAGSDQWSTQREQWTEELIQAQQPDGSWDSNTFKTASAILALDVHEDAESNIIAARQWLLAAQVWDGGWGSSAGLSTSNVYNTAAAVWALKATEDLNHISVTAMADNRSYLGGETVSITVTTSEENVDSLTGTLTSPNNQSVALNFIQVDATTWAVSYALNVDQPLGNYTITVNASKGELFGCGIQMFDVCLNRPINVNPFDGQMGVSLAPTLVASDFDDSQTTATHVASQWQVFEINTAADTQDLVYDSAQDNANLTSMTIPSGTFSVTRTYAWSVRYLDAAGRWSAWSNQTRFRAIGGTAAGANWLIEHQDPQGGWTPCEAQIAHTVEMLILAGRGNDEKCIQLVQKLLDSQRPDGHWDNEFNAVRAFLLSGMQPTHPALALSCNWIKSTQLTDGSWKHSNVATGANVWLLALLGQADCPEALSGAQWLLAQQNSDGGWGAYPGEASNPGYMLEVTQGLISVLGTENTAVQKALAYLKSKPSSRLYLQAIEIETFVFAGDLVEARRLINELLPLQLADGGWWMGTDSPSWTVATAYIVKSFARYQAAAGTADLDDEIEKALLFMDPLIDADNGYYDNYEQVLISGLAGSILARLGDEGSDAVQDCLTRFVNHGLDWYTHFTEPTSHYQTPHSAQTCCALIDMSNNASYPMAVDTLNRILSVQNSDGGFPMYNSGSSHLVATVYAMMAMHKMQQDGTTAFAKAYLWLADFWETQPGRFTPLEIGLSLLALSDYDGAGNMIAQLLETLESRQNSDGAWSTAVGYESRVLDTAYAVIGLSAVGQESPMLKRAVAWLRDQQNVDGGWGYSGYSNTYYTAMAMWALYENKDLEFIDVSVRLNQRSYLGGETLEIIVATNESDLDDLTVSLLDSSNNVTPLNMTQVDTTTWAGTYTLDVDQPLGTYTITANAAKGELFGSGVRTFDVSLNRPINVSPFDGQTGVSLSPTLVASDFDDSQTTATHVASQWQVFELSATDGTQKLVYDSGQDVSNLTSLAMGVGTLRPFGQYAWSVRYLDSADRWSAWSNQTQFACVGGTIAGANWLIDHQHSNGGWMSYSPLEIFSLEALAELGQQDSDEFERVLQSIFSKQKADGVWSDLDRTIYSLLKYGQSSTDPRIVLGLNYLGDLQHEDGSWGEVVVKTSRAVRAFVAAGRADDPIVSKAVTWLKSVQNADGGWGYRSGEESNSNSNEVYLGMVEAIGKDDPVCAAAYNYLKAKYQPGYTNYAYYLAYYLDDAIYAQDITWAQSILNTILAAQDGEGRWHTLDGCLSIHSVSDQMTSSLCRAKRAGLNVSDQLLVTCLQNVLDGIDPSGALYDTEEYVVQSARAAIALVASGFGDSAAIELCRQKFAAHSSGGWSNYFPMVGSASDINAWAYVAMHNMGGDELQSLLSQTLQNILDLQKDDGSWAQVKLTDPGYIDFAVPALYALSCAGMQDSEAFSRGVQWMMDNAGSTELFENHFKAQMLSALVSTSAWDDYKETLAAELLQSQNADGGWGSFPGMSSHVIETAMALLGLYAYQPDLPALVRARTYLLSLQGKDGGWGLQAGGLSSFTEYTAYAVWALAQTSDLGYMLVDVLTDNRSYLGGETVYITVTTDQANVDSLTGTLTSPDGTSRSVPFVKITPTLWTGVIALTSAQPLGTYTIAVNATKGELFGSGARTFDVGLNRPINVRPYNDQTDVSITPTLLASDFEPATEGAIFVRAEWIIREASTSTDYEDYIYRATSTQTSIWIPDGTLYYGVEYGWSVRYLDSNTHWTAWSDETFFTVEPSPQSAEQIFFSKGDQIWTMNSDGTLPRVLTYGEGINRYPRLNNAGSILAFCSNRSGAFRLWFMRPDGSRFWNNSDFQSANPFMIDWSPDDSKLVVADNSDTVYVLSTDGAQLEPIYTYRLLQVRQAAWSATDQIALTLNPYGNNSYNIICAMLPDGSEERMLISGGAWPCWNPTSDLLYYSAQDDLWRASVGSQVDNQYPLCTTPQQIETQSCLSSDASTLYYVAQQGGLEAYQVMAMNLMDLTSSDLASSSEPIYGIDAGWVHSLGDSAPNQPVNLSPADGATGVSLLCQLQASAYVDPDANTHINTRWQVRLWNETYDSPVLDVVSTDDLESIELAAGVLVPGQTYAWRARFCDSLGNVGSWSQETFFSTLSPEVPEDRVIIVAGGGLYLGNTIVTQTISMAKYAYRLSTIRKIPAENIMLMNAFPVGIDANNDGTYDDNATADLETLWGALDPVSGFAAGSSKLIIYMVDHGLYTGDEWYFKINTSQLVAASQLDDALDALQDAYPEMKIALVCDFCYSGGFVRQCAPQEDQYRICVSGSTATSLATFNGQFGHISFSNIFFDNLLMGANFKTAFQVTREAIVSTYLGPPLYELQVPWLEDDGDGVISTKYDGLRAHEFYWGDSSAFGAVPPTIVSVTPDQQLPDGQHYIDLTVEIATGFQIERVWAAIASPNVMYRDGEPITQLQEVNFTRRGTTQFWDARFSGLGLPGEYRVTFYASGGVAGMDSTTAMPRTITFTANPENACQSSWMLYE